jgi:branched-chain amino acid transport system substrate-binding protein
MSRGSASRGRTFALLLAVALVATGCDDDPGDAQRSAGPKPIRGDTLTIYTSLPAHGAGAAAARQAETGMRIAFERSQGRAGGRRVRWVRLSSTRPGDPYWNRDAVATNATRAARDPSTIAYLGELDLGGSSVSLPITNRAGILQVSPADGMTGLGRSLPHETGAGSARFYPTGRDTFVRFVPPDLDAARRIAETLTERRARRIVLLVGGDVASRELARIVVGELRRDTAPDVVRIPVRDDGRGIAATVGQAVAAEPDAVVYAGAAGPSAATVLDALAARLAGVSTIGGPQLSGGVDVGRVPDGACAWSGVPVPSTLPPHGRRLLARMRRATGQDLGTYALLGHASMRLTLDAIDRAGPYRGRVVAAARAHVDHDEVAVGYGLGNSAHVEPLAVDCVPLADGEVAAAARRRGTPPPSAGTANTARSSE